jgi:hypothetical protein
VAAFPLANIAALVAAAVVVVESCIELRFAQPLL